MRALALCLATGFLLVNSGTAFVNWRDDNPNQPNGYAASMYRYHHGAPDDDGPHDGYRASSIRSRNGLDRFAPPTDDNDSGGGRWGRDTGGFGSGSGLGRHFRQGQAESEAFWQNRMRSQMQNRMQSQMQSRTQSPMQTQMESQLQSRWQGRMQNQMRPADGAQANEMMAPRRFELNSAQSPSNAMKTTSGQQMAMPALQNGGFSYAVPMSSNYHYAPNSTMYSNIGALRSSVMQHPVGSLLRNSQGGFNQIYAPQ